MGGAGRESAHEVEDQELAATYAVLDVVTENPEIEHVADDVRPRGVHEHRGEQREVDRSRAGIELDRNALAAGLDRLGADEVPSARDLEWHGAVAVDESFAEAQLDEPDDYVDRDECVGDDGNGVAIRVVVSEGHYHVGSWSRTGLISRSCPMVRLTANAGTSNGRA